MLRDLLAQADIFSQGYRPQALAALGFSPEDAASINPGIIYVTLSAYGHAGPWAGAARLRLAGADRRPDSIMPRDRPPESMDRRNCRRRCSTTPPATSWRSAP